MISLHLIKRMRPGRSTAVCHATMRAWRESAAQPAHRFEWPVELVEFTAEADGTAGEVGASLDLG